MIREFSSNKDILNSIETIKWLYANEREGMEKGRREGKISNSFYTQVT